MPETTDKLYRNPYGPENDLPMFFRTSDEKYEFLARLALGHPSLQQVIDGEIFRNGWKQRLSVLRRKQRADGIADQEFLHAKRKKEKGIPVKPGRRAYYRRK